MKHSGKGWSLGLVFLVTMVAPEAIIGQMPNGKGSAEPLPHGALARLGSWNGRHGSRILCLAFAPDGRSLLAGGGNDPLRLWEVSSGRLLRTFDDTWVQAVAFSPRGAVFASGGAFKVVRLWEMATGKEYAQLKGHTSAIKALAMSADGNLLASADQGGVVRLWSMPQEEQISQLSGHTDEVNALAFSPDGQILASGSGDHSIRLWDVRRCRLLRKLNVSAAVYALVFSSNGQQLFAGGNDHVLRSWETATGKALPQLLAHQGTIVSLLLAGDGKTLISGGQDRSIRLWDLAKGREMRRVIRQPGDSDALALDPDSKLLATAGLNNTVRLFEVNSGQEVSWEPGHQACISTLALSPDGKFLASGCANACLRLWDTATGQETRRWQANGPHDLFLAFARDGKTILAGGGSAPVQLHHVATGQVQQQRFKDEGVLSLALSPDGQWAALGHQNQRISIWDPIRNQALHQLKYPGSVQTVGFAPDGKLLAAAGTHQVVFYDLLKGQETRRFHSKDGPAGTMPAVACLVFAPDGKTLALGCYDGVIRLFDVVTAKEVGALEGHASVVYALAFSHDGRVLASGSFDQSVRLWEMCSATPVVSRKGHRGAVSALVFASSGRVVYSGSADTTIVSWDVTGLSQDGKLPVVRLEPSELRRAWLDMASANTSVAHQALWQMVAAAKESVTFLNNQVFLVDPRKTDQLLADLNDNRFAIREKASSELARCGRWLEEVFQTGLQNPASEEVRRRLEKLLQRLNVPGAPTLAQERHRCRRTMMVLEQIDTSEARQLLHNLAQRAPEPELRDEAQASLQRLKRLRPAAP